MDADNMDTNLMDTTDKTSHVDLRRILIFLAFACGIAWATGLVIALTGGLIASPVVATFLGGRLTLAVILLAGVYMYAPTFAHLLTRALTREGWQGLHLRPRFKQGWKYWLVAWLGPALMTIAGAAIYFLLFPNTFDAGLNTLRALARAGGIPDANNLPTIALWGIFAAQLVQGLVIALLFNPLFTFGEEFGWRDYLLYKLLPLGERKAAVILGVIWGIWHWPVIVMGHNYGLIYPGYPWTGILAMTWFTVTVGVFLAWATIRAGSVWPAVIGHAILNGTAGIAAYLVLGNPNPVVGPMPVGIVGGLGFALVAVWILLRPAALRLPEEPALEIAPTPADSLTT